nr:uncharacterized protein LOC116279605 [Vicugna pacos]
MGEAQGRAEVSSDLFTEKEREKEPPLHPQSTRPLCHHIGCLADDFLAKGFLYGLWGPLDTAFGVGVTCSAPRLRAQPWPAEWGQLSRRHGALGWGRNRTSPARFFPESLRNARAVRRNFPLEPRISPASREPKGEAFSALVQRGSRCSSASPRLPFAQSQVRAEKPLWVNRVPPAANPRVRLGPRPQRTCTALPRGLERLRVPRGVPPAGRTPSRRPLCPVQPGDLRPRPSAAGAPPLPHCRRVHQT